MIRVGRMYAFVALGRLEEALVAGESLVALRGTVRYVSAMSSMSDAARAAELFECARVAVDAFSTNELYRSAAELQRAELQRAELLLEWGLRLEQVGRGGEADARFRRSVALSRHWAEVYADEPAEEAPLANALLALGLAKTGEPDEALAVVGALLVPLREQGQLHEARLVHLAYGVALRAKGRLREVAAVLRAHCRAGEVAVRFGGDEFALFLRTDVASAAVVAERIRHVIGARDWAELAAGLRVTLSMGLAAFADWMTGRDLYDRADRHLYVAKRTGRDRVAA